MVDRIIRYLKIRLRYPLGWLLVSIILISTPQYFCNNRSTPSEYKSINIQGKTMGTYYLVKIIQRDESKYLRSVDHGALEVHISAILQRVNQQMSTFQADSEISLFNRSRSTDWFSVSADTARVMGESIRVSRESEGAFDITVSPLIELWGFGTRRIVHQIPGLEAIEDAKGKIGYQKLAVRTNPPAIRKTMAEVTCNLSAIAKGFGVDQVAEFFDLNRIGHYLIDIGGEIRVKGYNPAGHRWTIGIAAPSDRIGVQKKISLADQSIATSGDYRNYYKKDGIRYSHTINPRTGKPISHSLASVSVIHDSCMTADAFATAINVLGPDRGYELALKHELPVLLIIRKDDRFIEKMSPSFKKLLH